MDSTIILYHALNYFFLIFHTVFTIFNIFGWMFKKLRKIHFITMLLTTASWFILGIRYGWGYCFCTDWHWIIRRKLGLIDKSHSYIHFLILKLSGFDLNEQMVVTWTMIIFFVCLTMTIAGNTYDLIMYIKKKKSDR